MSLAITLWKLEIVMQSSQILLSFLQSLPLNDLTIQNNTLFITHLFDPSWHIRKLRVREDVKCMTTARTHLQINSDIL